MVPRLAGGCLEGSHGAQSLSLAGFVSLVVVFFVAAAVCFVFFFNETSSMHLCSKPCKVQSSPSAGSVGICCANTSGFLCSMQMRLQQFLLQVGAERRRRRRPPTRQPRSQPSGRHTSTGARSASEPGQGPPGAVLSIHHLSAFLVALSLLADASQGRNPAAPLRAGAKAGREPLPSAACPKFCLAGSAPPASRGTLGLGPPNPPARRGSAPGCGRRSWRRGAGSWGCGLTAEVLRLDATPGRTRRMLRCLEAGHAVRTEAFGSTGSTSQVKKACN